MIAHGLLHYTIIKYIIEKGYAPDVKKIGLLLNEKDKDVIEGLYALQEYHGVVLHPNEPKIWAIHPFSLAPTNFHIKTAKGEWWGNCAWCSLGAAALIKEDLTITTNLGAHDEQVKINILHGEIQEKDLLIHFPISMKKAWDNVIYTCSNMLIFRSEEQIDSWTKRHNVSRGDVQSILNIWEFSKKWYGNHLNPNWEKWTLSEAKTIFQEFDLNHKIWELESSGKRF